MDDQLFTRKFVVKTVPLVIVIGCLLYILFYSVNYYFKIPENSIIYTQGYTLPITKDVETKEDTNLYKVTALMIPVFNRTDFLKVMWENRKVYQAYSWKSYDSTKEAMIASLNVKIDSNNAQLEKYNVFEEYAYTNYGEEEAEKFLLPIKIGTETTGNSDSLAIILALIGVHEEKKWVHSNKKIVITGNIDENGNVLPVGTIDLKALAAADDKADVFIVPKEQFDEAFKFIGKKPRMKVIPVTNVIETIEWLDANI
ncbi:S16 family serine protease [Bacillus sp. B190/17]|uniref:S16 family serine protease n=1 Tax=Bacillus lumedeiriae TaxID=3058829 RepID=A0ABW8IDC2_9BACI